jgi:hypothetical protein
MYRFGPRMKLQWEENEVTGAIYSFAKKVETDSEE